MGFGSKQLMSQVAATGPSAQRVLLPYRALRYLLKEEKTGFGFGLSAPRSLASWVLANGVSKGLLLWGCEREISALLLSVSF